MNKLEFLKLIANAPKRLKGYSELLDYARNAYKQIMGVFPEGIDNISIKQAAKEAAENRSKVIEFPKERITDPFKPRPGEGELSVTIEGQTKNMTPEGIMDFIMKSGLKGTDITGDTFIGKAPKTKKTKPAVDPELQKAEDQKQLFMDFEDRIETEEPFNKLIDPKSDTGIKLGKVREGLKKRETEAEMLERMKRQNKESVERLKKKKEKDLGDKLKDLPDDIPDMADGGRALMFKGGISKLIQKFKSKVKDKKAGDKIYGVGGEEIDVADFKKSLGLDEATDKKGMEDLEKKLQMIIGKDRTKHDMGGRIGFGSGSVGAVGFAGNQTEQSQPGGGQMEMPRNLGFQPIMAMPQKNIPGSGGMSEFRKFLQAVGAPELGMGYNFPVGQSGILGVGVAPSGNVGAQLKIPLSGGRFGFKDGSKPKSPGRRTFMKTMAGLAAIPFVGKLFKPAAKVAEAGGPAIAEGVKLGFDKFMMLVDKIKRLGRKTDRVTQQEREEGFVYTGKDGSEYELVEDLTTGDLRITKDKPGGMTVGDKSLDVIEDRSTFYLKRNQADETTKGRKPPDEYDEVKEIPGPDGTFDDVDNIDNETVKEILEELGETRTKKASGGLAYMLGE